MAHTKGPWRSDRTSDGYRYNICTETKGYAIADVGPDYSSIRDREQISANANIIAAAPELLEALEALVDIINVYGIKFDTNKATAAIKKAKGE